MSSNDQNGSGVDVGIAGAVLLDIDGGGDDSSNGGTHRTIDRDPATGGRYRKDRSSPLQIPLVGGAAPVPICQRNPSRSGLYIYNNGANTVLFQFGGHVYGTPVPSFPLFAGASYEMPASRDERGTMRALWTGKMVAWAAGTTVISISEISEDVT